MTTRMNSSGFHSMLWGWSFWALALSAAGVGTMVGCQQDEGTAITVNPGVEPTGNGAPGGTSASGGASGSGGADMTGVDAGGSGGGPGEIGDAQPPGTAPEVSTIPVTVEPPADAGTDAPATPPPTPSRPWSEFPQVIPGTIVAAYYDQGGEGIAYHDSDPQDLGADQARASNPTAPEATFRNTEGVDIGSTRSMTDKYFDSSPLQAGQLYVGWTVAGEWVKYTVSVTAAGHYTVSALVATLGDGARVTLSLEDGTTTGPRPLPWTHSFNAWRFADNIGALDLTAGTHVLTLKFESPDINIVYLTFVANPPTAR